MQYWMVAFALVAPLPIWISLDHTYRQVVMIARAGVRNEVQSVAGVRASFHVVSMGGGGRSEIRRVEVGTREGEEGGRDGVKWDGRGWAAREGEEGGRDGVATIHTSH